MTKIRTAGLKVVAVSNSWECNTFSHAPVITNAIYHN